MTPKATLSPVDTIPGAYELSYALPVDGTSVTHRLDGGTAIAFRDAGWRAGDLANHMAHLPTRLAECGIALGPVRVIEREAGPSTRAWEDRYLAAAAPLHGTGGPLFLFVDVIQPSGADAEIGGLTLKQGQNPKVAFIARHGSSGRRYPPEQRVAHELGHLMGLDHAPATTPEGAPNINLMQPRGCLNCAFTAAQCATLRDHPMASAGKS